MSAGWGLDIPAPAYLLTNGIKLPQITNTAVAPNEPIA